MEETLSCYLEYTLKVKCQHEATLERWVTALKEVHTNLFADIEYAEKIWEESHRLKMAEFDSDEE